MATSLDLAWATFQQHYSQAKQTWWQDHQADYLASVTSANQASSAIDSAYDLTLAQAGRTERQARLAGLIALVYPAGKLAVDCFIFCGW